MVPFLISWMNMMKIVISIVFIYASLPFSVASASEADTFTKRDEPLEDSVERINLKANDAISAALVNVYRNSDGCIERDLYSELRLYFNNHMRGKLTKDISSDPNISKRDIALGNSVYNNWTPWDGLGLGSKYMKKTKLTIAPIVKIGEVQMGTDKFEHMFGQGYFYFKDNYQRENGAISAVKMGAFREKTILGGNKLANGVFSYGDLSANFNGMRMWNHMLQLRDDVLGSNYNFGPYISCVQSRWVQVKEIDFRNYVDDSLDEAINCSKFPSQNTALKFTKTINGLGYSCPIEKRRLDKLVEKYGSMAKWMINESGTGVVKYFGEFKSKK
jgi:hypothetical protein